MNSIISLLCHENTYLTEREIGKIIEVSKSLNLISNFYEKDVFIDVLAKNKNEAIVVSHGKPKNKSIYMEDVVGKKALLENEPGVINTLITGITTRDIKALTQEYKVVKQTIQPITLDDKVIAVLIVEEDISNELKYEFEISTDNKYDKSKENGSKNFINLIRENSFLVDDLNSAILIFDKSGKLRVKNNNAIEIYKKLGFTCELQQIYYDEINLESKKLEDMLQCEDYNIETEVCIDKFFFKIKTRITDDDELKVIKIIEDISDIRQKEAELVLKSVALKEANHRIKNNLQTVISIIRKQSRLSKNEEVKFCLDNIINRVFAILSIHQLLSKETDDNISVQEAINLLIDNIQGGYCDNKDINIYVTGEDFRIQGEKASALLLVINEVIQNCYDHAFTGRESGNIQILMNKEDKYHNIVIIDNGVGFKENENQDKKSLGTFIIDSYITQVLRGIIKRKSDKYGTEILIKIPL